MRRRDNGVTARRGPDGAVRAGSAGSGDGTTPRPRLLLDLARLRIRRDSASPTLADWRLFAARRYRVYHALALCQGIVLVLAGFDVVIPFALDVGYPPAFAALLGALAALGGMAQIFVPRLLIRSDGNLRGLTMMLGAAGETRGLLLCVLALAVGWGLVDHAIGLVVLTALICLTGVLAAVTSANLLAWHSAVLPDADRRLVVPRLMAVSLAIGAILLLPVAILLDRLAEQHGLVVYALPFGLAGLFGIAEVAVMARLPRPGRVVVPADALQRDAAQSVELGQFLRVSTINAVGMGIAPWTSIYAMAVLGLSAGFAMSMGALSALTMVCAAAVAGSRLGRGSSARMLRSSFAIRAAAMAAPILAFPGSALAPVFLYGSVILGAVGFANGQLAANERLYRLISGPAVIRHHGRFLARTSGAMAGAQVASGAVLAAAGTVGYPVFAILYAASTGLRVVAYRGASPAQVATRHPATAEAQPLVGQTAVISAR